MRRAVNEGIGVISLIVSSAFGIIGAHGCPTYSWMREVAFYSFMIFLMCFTITTYGFIRFWKPKGYIEVANQPFTNTSVLLDGHIYIACKFTNVTFVYNGGDAGGFSGHCEFSNVGLRAGDPKLGQMLAFMREINLLREDAVGVYTPKSTH